MGLFKKKPAVEGTDISMLRVELVELRERLDATEQAKAVLEDRLSSIAATTMILSNTAQSNTTEIVEQIESLQQRLDTADAVGSKVDELHQRVIEVESRAPATGAGVEPAELTAKLAALSGRIEQVAQLAAAPAQPDDELAARLEQLSASASTVDELNQQYAMLSSRVSAQAEMADQLRALSERISLLQQRTVDTTEINERMEQLAMAAPLTEELGERVVDLATRVATSEAQAAEARAKTAELEEKLAQIGAENADELQAQLASLAARIAVHDALTDHVSDMEIRVAATESELQAARDRAAALEERLAQAPTADLKDEIEQQLNQRIDERIGEVHGRLDAHDQRTTQVAATATAASLLVNQLDALAARVEASEAELRAATERSAALEQQLAAGVTGDLDGRVNELAARLDAQSGVDERLAVIDGKLGELDARDLDVHRIHELLDQLRANTPSNDRVNEQLAELGERVAASEEAARVARDQANGLEERLGQIDGRVGEVDGRVGEVDGRVGEVHGRLDELNGRVGSLDGRMGDVDGRIGSLDGRIGDVDGRIALMVAQAHEIHELRERLDQLSAAMPQTDAIEQRLGELSQQVSAASPDLEARLEEMAQRLAAQAEWPDQLAALNARISLLQDHGVDVDRIHERLDQLSTSMPSTDGLHDELNRLAERLASNEGDTRAAREQAAALEDRLGNISTELANQLGELSNEIDSLASREPAALAATVLMDDASVSALKASQVKLANEQARYEITFREDLAALAEQVRQLRGRS